MRYRVALAIAAFCAGIVFVQHGLAQDRRGIPPFRVYGAPAHADDVAAIDSFIDAFRQSWGDQDTEALIALHADDTEWINAYARVFQDAAALGAFLEDRLFPAFDPAISAREAANMKIISIRHIGEDATVIHLYTDTNRGRSRIEGEEMRRTHIHLVLERRPGGWKVVHTAIMDAR